MAFCKNCGKEIPDNTKFCTYCGTKNEDAPKATASAAPRSNPAPKPTTGYFNRPKPSLSYSAPAESGTSGGWKSFIVIVNVIFELINLILASIVVVNIIEFADNYDSSGMIFVGLIYIALTISVAIIIFRWCVTAKGDSLRVHESGMIITAINYVICIIQTFIYLYAYTVLNTANSLYRLFK